MWPILVRTISSISTAVIEAPVSSRTDIEEARNDLVDTVGINDSSDA